MLWEINKRTTGKEWKIELQSSFSAVIKAILTSSVQWGDLILTMLHWTVNIYWYCREMLKNYKTIKRLRLQSSAVTDGIKQLNDVLFTNATLDELV